MDGYFAQHCVTGVNRSKLEFPRTFNQKALGHGLRIEEGKYFKKKNVIEKSFTF